VTAAMAIVEPPLHLSVTAPRGPSAARAANYQVIKSNVRYWIYRIFQRTFHYVGGSKYERPGVKTIAPASQRVRRRQDSDQPGQSASHPRV
jgi:hypothetical protein